jgi:phosphatidylinositol-3-phosphatase
MGMRFSLFSVLELSLALISNAALLSEPPSKVVLAIFENHGPNEIIGVAPYFTRLANEGAYLSNIHEVGSPSQPNYLGLFAGSTFGVTSDVCPLSFSQGNLAQQLISKGLTFVGYSEGLQPSSPLACSSTQGYRRKHAPWTNFPALPMSVIHKPFSAFPVDYSTLPTVSFVGEGPRIFCLRGPVV